MVMPHDLVVPLNDVDSDDSYFIGDHAVHSGRLLRANFPVPEGFVVTPASYASFLKYNELDTKITHLVGSINYDNHDSITQVAKHIRELISNSKIPDMLFTEIVDHYLRIAAPVTIHTAIVSGDSDQGALSDQSIFQDVRGESVLLDKLRYSWGSLFKPGLIIYRHKRGIDHLKTGIALTVQRTVKADVFGRIFTIDLAILDKSKIIIDVIPGFSYIVDKRYGSITSRAPHDRPVVFVRGAIGGNTKLRVQSHEIIALANLGLQIEKHFYFPQVIEWAKEGNKFFILSARSIA